MFIFGDVMSIFALRDIAPSSNSPFFIFSNKSKDSSVGLFLNGDSIPCSVGFFLCSVINSEGCSST